MTMTEQNRYVRGLKLVDEFESLIGYFQKLCFDIELAKSRGEEVNTYLLGQKEIMSDYIDTLHDRLREVIY